jgi:nitroreductase
MAALGRTDKPGKVDAVNSAMQDLPTLVATLMQSRQTILPKRLVAPGPDADQQRAILAAAASAPDHGQLLPWRFVIVPSEARGLLAEQFAHALLARDSAALPEQQEQAREKAFRAPLLMLAVVDGACGDPKVDLHERILSAGCAIQNMLLMATTQGFGSALTSGKALKFEGLRQLFALKSSDHALCFLSIGSVQSRKPQRVRPVPADYVAHLTKNGGVATGLPLHESL